MYVYHVVTERPMQVGQQIIFDEEHHSGVYRRVYEKMDVVKEIYACPAASCLYVSKTFEEADNWGKFFAEIGRPTYHIVKLDVQGNVFEGDATKCFKGTSDKQENLRLAERYWKNSVEDSEQQPVCEMLVDGCITVVEIVKEINANI